MKILLSFIFLASIYAHPTKYSVDRNATCTSPKPAEIKSWHIHLLFWENNEESKKGALEIRDKFVAQFQKYLGPECKTQYHQDHMCMFEVSYQASGPFVTAQWAAFVTVEHFYEAMTWAVQNRNDYDLLVHPNSGCELEDHSWWAFWSGTPWQLNLEFFTHDQPFPWDEQEIKKNQRIAEEQSLLIKLFNRGNQV